MTAAAAAGSAVRPASAEAEAVLLDRRVIAFRRPVLCAAIEAVGRRYLALPDMPVISVETLPDAQSVRFHFGSGATISTVDLTGQEITTLLIAYCIGSKIPLPTLAKKTVTVTTGGVVLDFLIAMATPPRCDRSLLPNRRVTGKW